VSQFNIHDPEDRPLVACQRIAVEINEVDVLAPAVDLKSVAIEQPDVHIRRHKSGVINLERVGIVAVEGDQKQRAARTKTGKAAVPLKFGSFVVQSGKVRFSDEGTAPTYEAAVEDLGIEARDFDNTVKDNIISASTLAGIRFNVLATGNVVKDNEVTANLAGIEFLVTPTGSATGNELKANLIATNGCGLKGPTGGNAFIENLFQGNAADTCP
jgi:hypothetical protein